jgi:tetratricopeptide (TPR) repeat protein
MAVTRDGEGNRAVAPMQLINYARALQDLAQLPEAAEYAERGYAKAQAAGAGVVEGQALLLEASIWRQQGKFASAGHALDQVEAMIRSSLPLGHIAFASLASQRSLLAQASGNPREAREQANEAVSLAEGAIAAGQQGRDYLARFLIARADIERENGDPAAAIADSERAVTLARAATVPGGFSAFVGRADIALGRALDAAGRARPAHDAYAAGVPNLERALGADHPETQAARQLAAR